MIFHGRPKVSGLESRTAAAVRRGEQLAATSRELIQFAEHEVRASEMLMQSLLQLRGFILENRRDLLQTLRKSRSR